MATSCEIKFDENPYGVYFPGQTLSGSVELRVAELTKVRGVTLQIKGVAEVRWSESQGAGKNRRTVHYHGRQDYMNSTSYLAGSHDGNNIDLLPGIHTYRFSCVLPVNLVTSLEAEYGRIRYTVKVNLDRPWKKDHSYKLAFTVLRHVNLNEENYDVRLPAKMEKAKTFCCGPCSSAPMHITAEVPISGYVPGQTIAVKIEVNNQSPKELREISTKLLRVVSFISQTPYCRVKTLSSTVAEVRCSGVDKKNRNTFDQYLLIPPLPPTSRTCQVLTVNYMVEVEGKISGININPRVQIPITLGTIPLSLSAVPAFGNPIHVAPVVVQPTAPSSSADPTMTPTLPAELPPPSYEEAVTIIRSGTDDAGNTSTVPGEQPNDVGWRMDFTPRYMVYRFSEASPTAPDASQYHQPTAMGAEDEAGSSKSATKANGVEKY